jgi:DNA-binding winged helix-turn-helix (wHTH) protein
LDAPVTHDRFLFEGFCLDRPGGGLFRRDAAGGDALVTIGSRALDVLAVLLAHPGELVSKQVIMQAVWPGVVVEEKNLAVQISALRRVLDDGRADRSCIQTEAGRGYRFVAPVTRQERHGAPEAEHSAPTPAVEPATDMSAPIRQPTRRHRVAGPLAAVGILALGALIALAWTGGWIGAGSVPPRLSIVVLPFKDMDDDPTNDYLADAITDDLTTELSGIRGAWVIARESAYTYKGKTTDVRQIGRELGVRYVLEGSVRQIGPDPAGQCSAHLRRDRRASVVGPVRRRDHPAGCRAAAHRRAAGRYDWHQHGRDRERAQPTRSADQSRRVRPDPAGALDQSPAAKPATEQGTVGAV